MLADEARDGLGLYRPGNDYVYRTSGGLTGTIEEMLAVRRRLADIEAVRLEPLHLG